MSYVRVKPNSPLSFWQHGRGFGAYQNVGNWTWEFDPFVFSFLAPSDSRPQPAPVISGFGGCGCGGSCGGCGGHKHGVGQASSGLFGTGLFTSSDPTQWGIGEWATIAGGLYVAGSLFGDIKSAGRRAGKGYRAAVRG